MEGKIKRIMNPNSLANLRKSKPRHHDYGNRYSIPQDKVDSLFLLLASDKTITQAAKEVGITFDTARKYFEKGDPRRGIEPLRKRLIIYQQKKTEHFSKEFIKRQEVLLNIVREQIDKLRDSLKDSIDPKKITYAALEKMIKLEIVLMGKPETQLDAGLLTAEDIKTLADKVGGDESI